MKTIKLFWEWFQGNEITLRTLRDQKSEIQKIFLYWLNRHLHNYCEALDCIIIYPEKSGQLNRLVVSANGDPAYFEKVTDLVHNAPILLNWKIIEFIQPSENIAAMEARLDKPYVFKDIVSERSELKFTAFSYESENKIDVVVYLKNFIMYCNNKNLLQAVITIIEDAIGDKSLYQNISFVELAHVTMDESNELIYLYEMQDYIDKINSLVICTIHKKYSI